MIMNSFEERWLEADNISFDSNDNPVINIWGINQSIFSEFIPYKIDVENEPDDGDKAKKKSSYYSNFYYCVYFFNYFIIDI